MKYIATFYSHFGAMRFKKEPPQGVHNVVLMPVPRDLSTSCGTSAIFEADCGFTFSNDPQGEIDQIVKVLDCGYEVVYDSNFLR